MQDLKNLKNSILVYTPQLLTITTYIVLIVIDFFVISASKSFFSYYTNYRESIQKEVTVEPEIKRTEAKTVFDYLESIYVFHKTPNADINKITSENDYNSPFKERYSQSALIKELSQRHSKPTN